VRPSETERGVAWIAQFELDDRPTASALLDSIRVASASVVLAGVRGRLERYIANSSDRLPVAVFPVLAKEDMTLLRPGETMPEFPVAFHDFDPSQGLPAAPGSEASMANIAREVGRGLIAHEMIKQDVEKPITIGTLREMRAKTLVFITDYIGSGKQVFDYVGAWYRNPTIRSWMSYGLIKSVVISYATSRVGHDAIRAISRAPELEVIEMAPSVGSPAEWQYRRDIVALCEIYAKRADLKEAPLGFADSAGLFASALSVPNNLPAILWESAPDRWMPFFEGRTMSAELANAIGDFVPSRDLVHELELAQERRLASRFVDGTVRSRWAPYLAILALLPADDTWVAERTGQTVPKIGAIRAALVQLGLVEANGEQTLSGRRAIERSRRQRRVVTAGLHGSNSPYYPRFTR
jgi:hypothetical protein